MSDEQGPKIGAGHASAMYRQGLKELSQALPAFPSSSIQPVEELGLAGTKTPQEVVQSKGDYQLMLDGYARSGPGASRNRKWNGEPAGVKAGVRRGGPLRRVPRPPGG